jgi:hypothetical protein
MPDERARILADAATKLTEEVIELASVVEHLGDRLAETEELAKANTTRVKGNERKANLIRALLVFDMLVTIGGFWLGYTLVATNARLDAVCPLYAFIIGTNAPQSRAAGPDRDAYNQAFADMRTDFAGFDCGPRYPIVPGAAHPPVATAPNAVLPGN